MNLSNKARKKATRNKLVEEKGVPARVESIRKIDKGKGHPRTRLRFVKAIRNKLVKLKKSIESRQQGGNRPVRGWKMKLDTKKKSRRDKIMRSNSFETQKVREISRKEAVSRIFFQLVDGNNRIRFPFGRIEKQKTRKNKNVKKIQAEAWEVFQHWSEDSVWAGGSGRREVGGSREKFTGGERKAEREINDVSQGRRLGGVQPSNLWLCYAQL